GTGRGAGEPPCGTGPCEAEGWQPGGGRDDRRSVTGVRAGAVATDPRRAVGWDVPTAAGEAGRNPTAGGRGTEARGADRAGPVHPASGAAGAAAGLGRDLFGEQLWVSSGALGASGGGASPEVSGGGLWLGGRPGLREGLRPGQPRQAEELGQEAGSGPTRVAAHRPVLEGRGADGRGPGSDGGRDATRGSCVTRVSKSAAGRSGQGVGVSGAPVRALRG